jgi:hypothetical protein
VTVGLVALPLAMAFSIASGLTPQAGIYCAIITGFLISALGGSRFQIGGPTGAFVVVVAGIITRYGVDGLFMCTLMAGVILVIMGLTGTGSAVTYIPRPVIIGFTNGIAIVIASTQLRDFLGLTVDVPGEFIGRVQAVLTNISATSGDSVLLGAGTLGVADRLEPIRQARAGLHRRALRRHRCGDRVRARRGNDRLAVWRHSVGPAAFSRAGVPAAADPRVDLAGADRWRCLARSNRSCPRWSPTVWAGIATIQIPSCSRKASRISFRRSSAVCRRPAPWREPRPTSDREPDHRCRE